MYVSDITIEIFFKNHVVLEETEDDGLAREDDGLGASSDKGRIVANEGCVPPNRGGRFDPAQEDEEATEDEENI